MKKTLLLLVALVLAVGAGNSDQGLLVIYDSRGEACVEIQLRLIQRLRELRSTGQLRDVPGLSQQFILADLNTPAYARAIKKLGLPTSPEHPTLALVGLRDGRPYKTLWSQPVKDIEATTAALEARLGLTPSGPVNIILKMESLAAVRGNPTRPTRFSLSGRAFVTGIWTYHWNDGRGSYPGTIALRNLSTGELFGPWPAIARPGAPALNAPWPENSEAPYLYWMVRPRRSLAPGTYEVVDSDPVTWATNAELGERGCTWVLGVVAPAPQPAVPALRELLR